MTENLQQQRRFFCDNCKREVFLDNKFCDNCGGELQWPADVQNILTTWGKGKKKSRWFPKLF